MTRKALNPKIQIPDKRQSTKLRKIVAPQFAIQDWAFLVLGAWDVGFLGEPPSDTSKELDKYVVVRVILHGQCSLQRKEAI